MNPDIVPERLDAVAAMIWTWSVAFLPRLLLAVIILGVGLILAGWVARAIHRLLSGTHVDPDVQPVVATVARYAVVILVLVAALGQIGVQTASLLAVLGAAGLAIGLALQGTLTNIAAGIMLLWLRPFRVGDYIETTNGQIAGTVEQIGLFGCHLRTFDGIFVFAPNGSIWNLPLRNHSRNNGRLVGLQVVVPKDADVEKARGVLMDVFRSERNVAADPPPSIFVDGFTASGTVLTCRLWASRETYGDVQRTVIEEARRRLTAAGIDTLSPQAITRTVPPDSDPSRLITTRSLGVRQPAE